MTPLDGVGHQFVRAAPVPPSGQGVRATQSIQLAEATVGPSHALSTTERAKTGALPALS